MSEKITRYLISEIKTVRIVCRKCKAVVEASIDNVGKQFSDSRCKFCGREYHLNDMPNYNAFAALQQASKAFADMSEDVEIHFVFPE